MNSGDYVWQADDWPAWWFDLASLAERMAEVSSTSYELNNLPE